MPKRPGITGRDISYTLCGVCLFGVDPKPYAPVTSVPAAVELVKSTPFFTTPTKPLG